MALCVVQGERAMLLTLVSATCLAAAFLGCVYLLTSAILVRRFAAQEARPVSRPVAVSILKPLHGVQPKLLQLLESFCRQDSPAPFEIACGARSASDPAAAAVERLSAAAPACRIRFFAGSRSYGSNGKVSNLIDLAQQARHDVLVISDGDIEVGPDYLSKVVGALEQPNVGAVSCLYHGVGEDRIWSQLSALAINTQFLPSVVFALSYRLARPCFGSTIALRRRTLEAIGGFESFADLLADDYAIGAAVREQGLEVAIPPFTVVHHCNEASLRELLLHEVRWARTVRIIEPMGYAASFVAHPLPLALFGILSDPSLGLMLAVAALASRMILCRSVEQGFKVQRQPYWLIPMRDLLSFGVFIWACFGATVHWKGNAYQVNADGTLVSDRSASET